MKLFVQIVLLLAVVCPSALARAKFEPPDGRVLHGAGQTLAGFETYWNMMPAGNKPLVYMLYTNLDTGHTQLEKELGYFSYNYPDCIPQIGVNWVWDFHPEFRQDAEIAAGRKDAGIRRMAQLLREYGRPVFLCPGYEFNGRRWNGYQPESFQEAWKRMVSIFREEQAANVAFIWTASAMGDPDYMNFYPGDDWTDWWGMNALEEQALGKPWVQNFLKDAQKKKMPVMICEASAIYVGTRSGTISWNRWFKRFFEAMDRNPVIKGFCYINDDWSAPEAMLRKLSSWGDCRIHLDPYVSAEYKKELGQCRYVHAATPAETFAMLHAANKFLPEHNMGRSIEASLTPPARSKPDFQLADPGTEAIVDYEKYGRFEKAGTYGYKYVITDREGLAKASGEGIDPNRNAAKNPAYAKVRSGGRLKKNIWDHRPHLSNDPEADYFAWAMSGEDPGVRLLQTGIALEEAGHRVHAIKAYRAAMILYPKSYGWSAKKRWTWLVAPVAWGRILHLTRNHPELNLKLEGCYVQTQIRIDGDPTRNHVAITPGKIVKTANEDRASAPDIQQLKVVERRGGKVAMVKYSNGHWGMEVDCRPFVVKGVTYTPTRVGKHLNEWNWMSADENNNKLADAPLESWVDANGNGERDKDEPVEGDFKLLKEMGCNTIRWINEHPLDIELLRKMHAKYGIRAAICEPLGAYVIHSGATWEAGTDYRDPEQRKKMLEAVRKLAEQVKGEPWMLCYILGNENNMPNDAASMVNASRTNAFAHPEAYATLLNEAARLIHEIDPDHPVGVGNQGWPLIDVYAKFAPELDFVGVNEYIGWHGFGALFAGVRGMFDRPVLVTEYGCDSYWNEKGQDEDWQARYHLGCWRDIDQNRAGGPGEGNAIGGIAFEFLDEWWKDNKNAKLVDGRLFDPDLAVQSVDPTIEMAFPDDWSQEECFGIVGQGDGKASPFLRVLKKSYYLYQEIWKGSGRRKPAQALAQADHAP